jgi:opacity protein-like surface antigen
MRRCIAALGVAAASLAASSARSADLPTLRGSVGAPLYRWEGGYFGAHVGYGFQSSDFSLAGFPDGAFTGIIPPVPAAASATGSGLVGGLQGGYLKQFDALVVGLEQDVIFGSIGATAQNSGTASGLPFTLTQSQDVDWLATTRAKIGFAPNDQYMIYATGGLAIGGVTTGNDLNFAPASFLAFGGARKDVRTGWAAGAGVEYALGPQFSATLEYLHFDLGHTTVVGLPNLPFEFETHTGASLAGDIVRAGVNYRFERDGYAALAFAPWSGSLASEIGLRYWYSTARTAKDLGDGSGALASRLTYSDLGTGSGEIFARSDDRSSGLFVKGFVGAGVIGSGSLKDEDFPPGIDPYSATNSAQRDGNLLYFSGDAGWNFYTTQRYRLGAFVGFFTEREQVNASGCTQVAGNPFVCVPTVSDPILTITETAHWLAARLGLNGEVLLWNCVKLGVDAAWLPFVTLDATDAHWLRMQPALGNFSGPVPETGSGHNGVQLEATVSYMVSQDFSVGVGARYWRLETDGFAHFENSIFGFDAVPQPLHFATERYGGFVQGAFRF